MSAIVRDGVEFVELVLAETFDAEAGAAKTSVLLFARTPRPAKSSGLRPAVIIASACTDKIQTSQQNAQGYRKAKNRTSQEEGLAPAVAWMGRAGASPSS